MLPLTTLLFCKVQFVESEVYSGEDIHLRVLVKSHFPGEVRFTRARIRFNEPDYHYTIVNNADSARQLFSFHEMENEEKGTKDSAEQMSANLCIPPEETRIFDVEFPAKRQAMLQVIISYFSLSLSLSLCLLTMYLHKGSRGIF